MRIAYESWSPGRAALIELERANAITAEYQAAGYTLTLRQLYYQFVARGLIPNTQQSYKRLGSIINNGRMAGFLDWDMVEDRTRNLQSRGHWNSPADIIASAMHSYHNDLWSDQDVRVEVWVEKEALAGVVQRVASRWDCAWFSCRGYVSQSELWGAGRRIGGYIEASQRVVVLHLGDHDPSGIDMTRDITDRLNRFIGVDTGMIEPEDEYTPQVDELEVRRIALNMDQVRQYNPPPNPAKLTDSRANGYIDQFGDESWELDALPPEVLDTLIDDNISDEVDFGRFRAAQAKVERERLLLKEVSERWDEVESIFGE